MGKRRNDETRDSVEKSGLHRAKAFLLDGQADQRPLFADRLNHHPAPRSFGNDPHMTLRRSAAATINGHRSRIW